MSELPEEIRMIATQYRMLTFAQRQSFWKWLQEEEDDFPDIGVREPRPPRPQSGATSATLEIPTEEDLELRGSDV